MAGPGVARRWVALLRAVNAGRASTIRMGDLRDIFTSAGFLGCEEAGPLLKAAFSPVQRAGTRMLGVRQFLRLDAVT
jgi:hypothetical protein